MYSNDGNERVYAISRSEAHDLKNRLTVIKGIAQLLGRQLHRADWEQQRIIERVDTLQHEIAELETMLHDLRPRDAPVHDQLSHTPPGCADDR